MKVNRIDHIVLTVHNIEVACEFYSRVFGMQVITFGNGQKSLLFGEQKINLHGVGEEFEPKAQNPTPGSADLCFITSVPLKEVLSHLQSCGVDIINGPVKKDWRNGANYFCIFS